MALRTCVLIPSYNEARTIGELIRRLIAVKFAVYIVDDGSSDDTYTLALNAGARVLRHNCNLGKGASLRDGFELIMKDGYDAVLVMDGDGQHEVASAPEFIKKMESTGADIVIGNRMGHTGDMPFIRLVTNRFMSALISGLCHQNIPDSQCGFRLIKREVIEKVTIDSCNYDAESEFLIKAARYGFKFEMVPIRTLYSNEISKINPFIDTLRFIRLLFRLGMKR